jgi:D-cysteine desulfhydrase
MARLANRTGRLLGSHGMVAPVVRPAELDLRTDWLGAGYGDPTPAAVAEVERATAAGLDVEPVYTGKALAAVRDLAARGELPGPVLWLGTHGPR